jgi:NAD(P)H-dependent flavin oxidoreductase YrpB (nitropropane dioxygenase family)
MVKAKTLADEFGIGYPIFAFSHCRDVVAEVSRQGGLGVLGGVGGEVDILESELAWLDEHCGGNPYGLDTIMPARTADTGTEDPLKLVEELRAKIPIEHREFVRKLLRETGLEPRPIDAPVRAGVGSHAKVAGASAGYRHAIDIAVKHPNVKLFVGALGTPAPDIIDKLHSANIKVGALAGNRRHAERHVREGVDIIVAQGTEAGGHTGDITTMVLVPEIVDAVAPIPVLAAGGIGTGRQMAAAIALGAQGVWTGSIWMTVSEANTPPSWVHDMLEASSSDTVRSRSSSGKPIRQLRSKWTEAWERPDAPPILEMPLQGMLLQDALPDGREAYSLPGVPDSAGLAKPIVGQIVGRMNEVRSTRAVLEQMVQEFVETVDKMSRLAEADET